MYIFGAAPDSSLSLIGLLFGKIEKEKKEEDFGKGTHLEPRRGRSLSGHERDLVDADLTISASRTLLL